VPQRFLTTTKETLFGQILDAERRRILAKKINNGHDGQYGDNGDYDQYRPDRKNIRQLSCQRG
jgi:hypothetical protein